MVAHLLWEQGVAGSNPAVPMIGLRSAMDRGLGRVCFTRASSSHAAVAARDVIRMSVRVLV